MSPGVQVLLSGGLTFGVPLVLAIRELFTLNDGSSGPYPRREPPPPVTPEPPRGSNPAATPLPACLIEAAMGNKIRELEPA